jgi:hypothetical protein
MASVHATPRAAGSLAATVILIHRRPSAAFSFLLTNTALFIALGDVIGFALLLVGVFGFVAARHRWPPQIPSPTWRICLKFPAGSFLFALLLGHTSHLWLLHKFCSRKWARCGA